MSIESQGIPRETSLVGLTRVGTYPQYACVLTVGGVDIALSLEAVTDVLALLVMYPDGTCGQTVHRGIRRRVGRDPGVLVAHVGAYGDSGPLTLAVTVDGNTVVARLRERGEALALIRSATHRMVDSE